MIVVNEVVDALVRKELETIKSRIKFNRYAIALPSFLELPTEDKKELTYILEMLIEREEKLDYYFKQPVSERVSCES